MNRTRIPWGTALVVLSIFLTASCTPTPSGTAPAPLHSVAGGCAGTVVTDSVPPVWSQTGFRHTKGTPWPVPWALGKPGDAVAFLFTKQLVAGSPLVGGPNKVRWSVKDKAADFVVEGRRFGQSQPVLIVQGGHSDEAVPTPGCWTFRVLWGGHRDPGSTINLEVLPGGTLPAR